MRQHRGRLFHKYFLLILALVCGALLISGGVGLYFAYQENKEALASLQREKAAGAAARIEQFVSQIEQQLAFAALPQLGAEGLEQRRIEFLKLLRVVPAVTDIAQIDATGREQIFESRLGMSTVGADKDRSQEPAFRNARPGQTWFGPVYFRKETEPYMSIAVRSGGESGPLTVAEVNLKFIWDVVTRIRIGEKGKAYVVDATGHLVADPDIGLVLRKTNLSQLEQVQAAFAPGADDSLAMLAKDLNGHSVLTAYAPIEPAREQAARGGPASTLGWKVFVEQPVAEVYAALDATIVRIVALIVAGLLFSALAAMYLARSMVRPIRTLQEGAQRIGAGDLDSQIEVRTGDELEALAAQFNRMTAQLRESYTGLERKVEQRTGELKEALSQQTASSKVLEVVSGSPSDLKPVFDAILESASDLCEAHIALLNLYDGTSYRTVAQRGTSREFSEWLAKYGPFKPDPVTSWARIIKEREPVQVADLRESGAYRSGVPYAVKFVEMGGARTYLLVPLLKDERFLGAIAIFRPEVRPFSNKQTELLTTFARQAVIAIEKVRLFNETKESLEQQTATAEILKVISGSTTDTQPVFEAIVHSAAQLFAPCNAFILMRDGPLLRMRAIAGATIDQQAREKVSSFYPVPFDPEVSTSARAMVERRMNACADTEAPGVPQYIRDAARAGRFRANTVVPLVRDDEGIGSIVVTYPQPGHTLTDKQLALLRTFADQAVIAIENVRLFNETKESLERQTATSDILRVISSSTTDVQPVFEAIVKSAAQLFPACNATIFMRDGGLVHRRAMAGATVDARMREEMSSIYPVAFDPEVSTSARAMAERRANTCLDTEAPEVPEHIRRAGRAGRFRSNVVVPLVRDDEGIGTIVLTHPEPGYTLTDKQLALLQTFADQAVIAIENVRLFNETKESLEQQTATAEILKVISSSTTDTQPVFEAIVQSGLKLFPGAGVVVVLPDGDQIRVAAIANADAAHAAAMRARFPIPLTREYMHGVALLDRRLIDVPDAERPADPSLAPGLRNFLASGSHAITIMPMLRGDAAIGAISVVRQNPGPLDQNQIALLRTFADQAVIAIENVRLFNETKEALEQQTATSEILKVISRTTFDLQPVLQIVLDNARKLCDADRGTIFRPDEAGRYLPLAFSTADGATVPGRPMEEAIRRDPIRADRTSATGRAIVDGVTVHIPDVRADAAYRRLDLSEASGYRSILAVPMLRERVPIGVLTLARTGEARPFADKQIELVTVFADQAVIAIENVRLFREIQEKSAQLEVANKHKSEFLANMSHELRTPLNAIIGFSEVLIERMFGEINPKQADYLKDIHESGKHLLSLINDILDLSKIEAGRMDLELSSFDLPSALSNAMTLVRERAQRHAIQLSLEVDERLGSFEADERKFKQIVLNLLSNAVKFTPDGGKVGVSAKPVDGRVEIQVRDTGIGIAPEDHAAVFEEFKQVGRDYTRKAEGTGLGLALTRRFVELHGGAIGLESAPGKGSTFTITLPVRQ